MAFIDWMRLLLLASVWGCSFFLIEIALGSYGPFTIVLARISLAAVALFTYCRIRGIAIDLSGPALRDYAIMGFLANVAPFSLIALGQMHVESGLASIFIAATPLLTVAVAHAWGQAERATAGKIAGTILGLAGVAVMMGNNMLGSNADQVLGELALLAAAFCYAFCAVYGRRFSGRHPAANAATMVLASCPTIALLAFTLESPLSVTPTPEPLLAMAALGLLSTAFAQILYFTLLANAGSTNSMLVTLVQPPVAIMLGIVFLGERLDASQFAGFGLIAIGLLLVDGRLARLLTGGRGLSRRKDRASS